MGFYWYGFMACVGSLAMNCEKQRTTNSNIGSMQNSLFYFKNFFIIFYKFVHMLES